MANEVIVEEYSAPVLKNNDGSIAPVPGVLVTSQVLNIAELSATLNALTTMVRLQSKGTGFWYIIGDAATADTDGNRWLPADQYRDILIRPGTDLKIDTAA